MTTGTKPVIKHKTFSYYNRLEWLWRRSGILGADEKPEIAVSSPPEFKGDPGVWTPEDLFVASVNICQMTTFLAFAERKQLPLVSYHSEAEGTLEFVDGKYRFTRIILRPKVCASDEQTLQQLKKVMEDAHGRCLISNSISSEVILEPVFLLKTEESEDEMNSAPVSIS